MDKRKVVSLGLGVLHKKKLKKPNKKKKGLLNKVADYLISDSCMFAPLVSSQPSDFSPTKTISTPPTVETEKPSEETNKKLLEKVGEYLEYDCYMFAPLIHDFDSSRVSPPHKGPVWHLKRMTTEVSTRKITKKIHQPTKHTLNNIREDQPSDNSLISSTVVRQTLAHREKVKHIVHQNCRSSSVPGKGMLEKE